MKATTFLVWGAGLLAGACTGSEGPARQQVSAAPLSTAVRVDSMRYVDAARSRPIPVVTYAPAARGAAKPTPGASLKVALLNHGYGERNTAYSFLARNLVAHGYFVVSLQHELPGDAPIATTGNLAEARRPSWEQGVKSMVFVLQQLRQAHPEFDYRRTLLVGHSHGGDMVMLCAREHPDLAWRVISLDNRRMPLPRVRRPRLLSLRSSDQRADDGVLPTLVEQTKYRIRIVQLTTTRHNDMWDGATAEQKREMNTVISRFIAE
ncbi:serine aminopeptidase domain-containing protein [Hymenobacter sp.]|uniref:serine aminopeptidase domain-containing protein n=1 Tax=Hymenobacter sp. TaxID=1898978 RepID=UPI00286B0CA2|nr:alpha/beta hydrolase [Hymenobacter sp.]